MDVIIDLNNQSHKLSIELSDEFEVSASLIGIKTIIIDSNIGVLINDYVYTENRIVEDQKTKLLTDMFEDVFSSDFYEIITDSISYYQNNIDKNYNMDDFLSEYELCFEEYLCFKNNRTKLLS